MNNELLPCPFCGANRMIVISEDGYNPTCSNVGCPVFYEGDDPCTKIYDTVVEADAAWNRRTPTLSKWEEAVLEAAREWQKIQAANEAFRRIHGPLRADQHDQAEAAVDRLFAAIEQEATDGQ